MKLLWQFYIVYGQVQNNNFGLTKFATRIFKYVHEKQKSSFFKKRVSYFPKIESGHNSEIFREYDDAFYASAKNGQPF